MASERDTDRWAPWICALAAVILSALAVGMLLSSAGWNLTSLLRMTAEDPIATIANQVEGEGARGEGNVSYVPAGHYDGVYYYAIAIDPFATGEAHKVIDLASHRYGHPGYGWLGWLASFGNPSWVPQALIALSFLGMAIGAYFASLLSRDLGLGPWGGALVAFNPGLIFSVTTDTSEAVTMALMVVGLWLWFRDRRVPAAVLIALTCFFKFQMLLVPVGLGVWEIVRYLRGKRDTDLFPNLALLAIGPGLFLFWLRYLSLRFGEIPTSGGQEFLSFPFVGWFDTMAQLGRVADMAFQDVQIASAELPILVVLLGLFVTGLFRAARMRHPLDAVFLFQGLFVLLLNWWNLLYPKDLIRALAIPIPLLVAVFFIREGTPSQEAAEEA